MLVCVSGVMQASVKTRLKQLLLMSAVNVKPGFQTGILILLEELSVCLCRSPFTIL